MMVEACLDAGKAPRLAQQRRQQVASTPCWTRNTRFGVAQDAQRVDPTLPTSRDLANIG